MNVLDLFSGIGGFSLGLERAGFKTVAFCECEQFCQKVLRKHWPDVPIYDDVRELTGERLQADGIGRIDVICGGFPCQDISVAGKGAGIKGERSGLWSEFARIIGEVRPRYAIVENVSALLGRGLGTVLGDLAALGYDAEWHCIPASEVGAPHGRDRLWVVAYAARDGRRLQQESWAERENSTFAGDDGKKGRVAFAAYGDGLRGLQPERGFCDFWGWFDDCSSPEPGWQTAWPEVVSALSGMDDGISSRLDKDGIDALGNAVVPQIPEMIGRAIMEVEQQGKAA